MRFLYNNFARQPSFGVEGEKPPREGINLRDMSCAGAAFISDSFEFL